MTRAPCAPDAGLPSNDRQLAVSGGTMAMYGDTAVEILLTEYS